MKGLACILFPLLILVSCSRGNEEEKTLFQVEVPDVLKGQLNLGETQLSAVNQLTCFAYNTTSGMLETVSHENGDSFCLSLDKRAAHKIYVLANLGNLCDAAPLRETEMQLFSCAVPSLATISTGGVPMCGSVYLPAGEGSARISLRRLMSRFFISVKYGDTYLGSANLRPRNIKVRQSAKVFYPFAGGGSAVKNTDEVTDTGGDEALFPLSSGNCVELFIPENCQGDLLSSDPLQMDKSMSNPELGTEKGYLCSYIEVYADKINGGDGISGEVTYRFFPGNGSARNFDIRGGYAYYIDLVLSWNGMFVEGNWKVERGNWLDERSLGVCASENGIYGNELTLQLPPGAYGHKHYLRFSPLSDGHHSAEGWSLSDENGPVRASILSQGSSFAAIGVSIDAGAQTGSRGSIVYSTPEGRHKAKVNVDIVEAFFSLDRNVVVCSSSDLNEFTVRVAASNVPLHQISVISTDSSLELLSYDAASGIARARWKHANDGSSRRSASLVFSGLGAVAVCSVHQMSPSTFTIEDEGYGGDGGQVF